MSLPEEHRREAEPDPAPPASTPPGKGLPAAGRLAKAYRKIALDLQHQRDAMHHSRTWQLALAWGLASRSFRDALRLPGRVLRILIEPPGPRPAPVRGRLTPQRSSVITAWPPDLPLVSVIVLLSSDSQAAKETIESLRTSTFLGYEVLLSGGTPGMLDRLSGSRDMGPLPRLIETSSPGSTDARNAAIEQTKGKYILLLRAGDRLEPTFLEKTAWALEASACRGFAYTRAAPDMPASQPQTIAPFDLERALRYNHTPDSALFRKEAWEAAGGFHAEAVFDYWDFWVTLGAHGWDGFLVPEELVHLGPASRRASLPAADVGPSGEGAQQIRRRCRQLLDAPRGETSPANERRPKRSGETVSPDAQNGGPVQDLVSVADELSSDPHATGRVFLDFGAGKPALLYVVPWLDTGGAENVVLQLARGLGADFPAAIATTVPSAHNRAADFRAATPWLYHLPELGVSDPGRFLAGLAFRHGVRGVVVSSSKAGYEALPEIKKQGLWTADILHNTAPEGRLDQSIRFDAYLDKHFPVGSVQAAALRNAPGIDTSKIHTIWTSVDARSIYDPHRYRLERDAIRKEFGIENGDIVLVSVGRLAIEKDVPLFVSAVSEIVRGHLDLGVRALIVGEGPERLRVEQAIEREGLEKEVTLLGDSSSVPEILAAADYLLLTSRIEGSPITLLEGMSMKLLVLSTAVGSVPDMIQDGVNGFVVAGRDPAEFADRFRHCRQAPEREAHIREAARRTVLEKFDETLMLRRYSDAFSSALGSKAAGRSV